MIPFYAKFPDIAFDESYVERLRKHYEMFKGAIKDDHSRAKKARAKSRRK